MTNSFKFKLNSSGVKDLLKSDEMQAILVERATRIKYRCGEGYEQDIFVGKKRANAMVWADSVEARKDNMENNTLLKAVKK